MFRNQTCDFKDEYNILAPNANDVLYSIKKKETAERSPIVLGTVETPEVWMSPFRCGWQYASGYFSRWRWKQRLRAVPCCSLAKSKIWKQLSTVMIKHLLSQFDKYRSSAQKNYFWRTGNGSYLVDNTAWEGTNAKWWKRWRMVTII